MSIEGAYPGVNFSEIHCGEGTVFNSRTELAGQRNVFSYTSPVYATVNGKPIRSWDDHLGYMQHAIDWLNNGGTIRQRRGPEVFHRSLRTGRAVYEQRARESRQTARR
jgi:hypothetical protein